MALVTECFLKLTRIVNGKAKKKGTDKYDTKHATIASFEDVIKVMVTPGKHEPKKVDKSAKKN